MRGTCASRIPNFLAESRIEATWRRLCVLRQIGDQLIPGLEQFLFVDDVVAVEDGAALVTAQYAKRLVAERSTVTLGL